MSTRPRLNDQRTAEALNLLKHSDSVEFKLTVPDTDQHSAVAALDLDPLDAELRQVVFFDTPDLKLSRGGLVVRARRIPQCGDAVIKLRPVVPTELSKKLRRSDGFTIEVDMMPDAFVCSGSLKVKVDNVDVKEVLAGNRPIRKLFQHEQRSFYKEHAPANVDLDSLTPFGPITVVKLKFSARRFWKRMAVAELWFYPDASRILEISTKCAQDEAFQVLAETRAFLTGRGITATGEQQTKTRKALQYFSRLHADAQP